MELVCPTIHPIAMSQSAIAIIGTEGSGKSVFVAALAHVLQDAPVGQTRLVPKDMQTARYCAMIVDQLNAGKKPASTAAGTLESLAWDWIEPDGTIHPMSVLDCAGQDFRQIFEGSNALDPHQHKLSVALHAAKVVILLVNLNEAIEAHGLSQSRRLDLEFAPAMALRALKKSGAVTMLILSQHDIYRDHLESEQLASPAEALRKYLPQLANAAEETQTCVAFCSAIKTQVVSTNGIPVLQPAGVRLTELPSVAGQIQHSLNSTPERLKPRLELMYKQKKWDVTVWPITLCSFCFGCIGFFIGLMIGITIGVGIGKGIAPQPTATGVDWELLIGSISSIIGGLIGLYSGNKFGKTTGLRLKRMTYGLRPE